MSETTYGRFEDYRRLSGELEQALAAFERATGTTATVPLPGESVTYTVTIIGGEGVIAMTVTVPVVDEAQN